jgi:hypothetical protein
MLNLSIERVAIASPFVLMAPSSLAFIIATLNAVFDCCIVLVLIVSIAIAIAVIIVALSFLPPC